MKGNKKFGCEKFLIIHIEFYNFKNYFARNYKGCELAFTSF